MAVLGGEGVFSRLRLGRASDDLRKSMKEVLPQFLAPMMRMLVSSGQSGSLRAKAHRRGHSLERGWVLPSPHPARAVDAGGADGTAGIAVAASMRHTLCPCVRIDVVSILRRVGAGRHGRHRDAVGWTADVRHGSAVRCRINTQRAANRVWVDLRMGRELGRGLWDGRGLLALLLLVHCLVGALLAAEEVETGATLLRGSGSRGRQLR